MSYLGDLSRKSCPFRALAAEDRDLIPPLVELSQALVEVNSAPLSFFSWRSIQPENLTTLTVANNAWIQMSRTSRCDDHSPRANSGTVISQPTHYAR